ncbi:hypothetical protein OPV22_002658 [Ensete ventricosum]|uniref:Uncharacterized protein n=1 Tax=Ensete ventricosum TaxID=4639 RepID=A0AAV8RYK9_ENSVE|nr:hypothetical protein OPV22_002658 [Ensete ventricosum]
MPAAFIKILRLLQAPAAVLIGWKGLFPARLAIFSLHLHVPASALLSRLRLRLRQIPADLRLLKRIGSGNTGGRAAPGLPDLGIGICSLRRQPIWYSPNLAKPKSSIGNQRR